MSSRGTGKIEFPYPLRKYQRDALNAFIDYNFGNGKSAVRNFYFLWCARAGKDLTSFFMLIIAAIASPNSIFAYFFPDGTFGDRVLMSGHTDDGYSYLDMIPKEELMPETGKIKAITKKPRRINFANGSIIHVLSAQDRGGLAAAGTTWQGAVVSEFAHIKDIKSLMHRLRPRIHKTSGFLILNTTPTGPITYAKELWDSASASDEWYATLVTLDDCLGEKGAKEYIEANRHLSEFEVRRELYCDFNAPLEHVIYADILRRLETVEIHHDPRQQHYIAFDLGFKRDGLAWWVFTAPVQDTVCFIDFGIQFSADLVDVVRGLAKSYRGATVFLPHDADDGNYSSFGTLPIFGNAGFRPITLQRCRSVEVEIKNVVRPFFERYEVKFSNCENVEHGIEYLKMYRRSESNLIVHGRDGSSDVADALRYAVVGYKKHISDGPDISIHQFSGESPYDISKR